MSEGFDYVENGFKVLVGIAIAVGGWLWTSLVGDVKSIQKQVDEGDKALLQHKLDTEKTYAGKAEVQNSLSRIHDRLDSISEDIKSIISKVGNSNHNDR